MTQITRFRFESWPSTQPSVSVIANEAQPVEVEIATENLNVPVRAVSVRNRLAVLEADPRRAKLLQEARRSLSGSGVIEKNSLKQLRLSRGYSQEQLAKLMGSTQAQVAKLEAGRPDVRLSTVVKIAAALGVSSLDVAKILIQE
jgi:DNA-binding XRE family transcriptional regulator